MTNTNEETRTGLHVALTITDESFFGTPEEIVTGIRKTSIMDYADNDVFMREWARRAELFTKVLIAWETPDEFIKTNIQAGFMTIIEKGDLQ